MNIVPMKKESPNAVVAKTIATNKPPSAPLAIPMAGPTHWQSVAGILQRNVLPPLLGMAVFVSLWALVSATSDLPTPLKTFYSAQNRGVMPTESFDPDEFSIT